MQLVSTLPLQLLLLNQVCVCFPGANLTANLDRIKIVFTPMMCRRVCTGGRCYNSCEKGDITTVYSEQQQQQQQQQPQNQGFRLCECRLQALWLTVTLLVRQFFSAPSRLIISLVFSLSLSLLLIFWVSHTFPVSILVSHSFFYVVSLTKWVLSGMLSVLNTKLRKEAKWWRLKLRATLKKISLSKRRRPREPKRERGRAD